MIKNLIKSKLAKGGLFVLGFILVGRIIQFVKELFVAKEIGISPELDAFIMAHLILGISLSFLFQPVGYALLPIFIRLRQFSVLKANLLFTKVLLIVIILGFFCMVSQFLLAEHLLSFFVGHFKEAYQKLTGQLLFQLSPFYVFSILNMLFGIYLNALQKNFLYSIYPAFPALFTILFFLFIPLDQPIYQQVYGFNSGSFFICCILIYACYQNGFRPALNLKFDKTLQICFQQWLPLIFAALMISLNPIIDKKMAADLGVGSVSHLEYGYKLFSVFTSFSITGITIVLYPYFSKKIAERDYKGVITFLKKISRLLILPLLIGTIGTIYFAEEIIRILFERGAFNATDTKIVSEIMIYYLVCLPILTFGMIGVRLVNSLQLNKLVMYFSGISLILNILLNILFIDYFGLKGVALSTSVVYTVNAILMWGTIRWFFNKKRKVINENYTSHF